MHNNFETIMDAFSENVKTSPDKVAAQYQGVKLTYSELDRRSGLFSDFLKSEGIKAEDIVSIETGRSLEALIAILGIWKTGAAYIFLESSFPEERKDECIRECNCTLRITLQDVIDHSEGEGLEKGKNSVRQDSLATIIYTSGSTGKPKGVMITHKNIISSVSNSVQLGFSSKDRICLFASMVFVAALYDICAAFLNGATICIIPKEYKRHILDIAAYYGREKITVSFLPPHMAAKFMDCDEEAKDLRLLIVGSEPARNLEKKRYEIVNVYASSELCAIVAMYRIEDKRRSYPIGKIVPGLKWYITDDEGKRVCKEETGELWIAGPQVSPGYAARKEMTAAQFVKNPFSDDPDYATVFHTRDMVRELKDGNLEYVCRKDSMYKIRGFRIEADSVEVHMLNFPDIKQAYVTAFTDAGGTNILFGYYISDKKIDKKEFREYLTKHMPYYGVPTCLIQMKEFPMTTTGKINRKGFFPPPEINDHKLLEKKYG